MNLEHALQIHGLTKQGGKYRIPETWAEVQEVVRKGVASEIFNIGSQLISNYKGSPIVWEVIGIDVDTPTETQYQHSMTLQTRDSIEKMKWNETLNNNIYVSSSIKAYLNNDMLNNMDPELSAVLGSVTKKVARHNDFGGGQDSFNDKLFLLSQVEVGFTGAGVTSGERVYPFYNNASRPTMIKAFEFLADYWWLRSPHMEIMNRVKHVSADGRDDFSVYTGEFGISPACVIV